MPIKCEGLAWSFKKFCMMLQVRQMPHLPPQSARGLFAVNKAEKSLKGKLTE